MDRFIYTFILHVILLYSEKDSLEEEFYHIESEKKKKKKEENSCPGVSYHNLQDMKYIL